MKMYIIKIVREYVSFARTPHGLLAYFVVIVQYIIKIICQTRSPSTTSGWEENVLMNSLKCPHIRTKKNMNTDSKKKKKNTTQYCEIPQR